MLYSAPLKYLLKVGGEVLSTTAQTLSGAVNELKTALSSLATVARTGSYNDLLDLPTLAVVATSNNYNDLDNRPTLGTAASKDVPASGNADNSQVVLGNDSRLTDARTPTSHTHTKSQITDFSHTHNYAGSDSAGGQAHSAAYADLLKYTHGNEINFKGGAQTICWFNYRNADTDAASATSSMIYKFCNYSNDVSKSILDAGKFTGNAATASAVKDSNNNTNTTFAYSKAGMAYDDYTWLAGWNGYELRGIAKSQFQRAFNLGEAWSGSLAAGAARWIGNYGAHSKFIVFYGTWNNSQILAVFPNNGGAPIVRLIAGYNTTASYFTIGANGQWGFYIKNTSSVNMPLTILVIPHS